MRLPLAEGFAGLSSPSEVVDGAGRGTLVGALPVPSAQVGTATREGTGSAGAGGSAHPTSRSATSALFTPGSYSLNSAGDNPWRLRSS